LVVLDPVSGEAEAIALPVDPAAVSIHPDESSAAVAHDGYMSIVDLEPLQLVDTLEVTADLFDVVLAANGYAYGTAGSPSQWQYLHSLELATGEENTASIRSRDSIIRLHPAGDRIYSTSRGITPGDVERFDIVDGIAQRAYDSPYHGDYDMGLDLWLSEDGARIFTASGTILRTSNVRMDDIVYEGALATDLIQSLDHSAAAGLIALVSRYNEELLLFDDALFELVDARPLPTVVVGSQTYATTGRFVFFSADGASVHVIAKAEDAPVVHNEVIVSYEVAGP
jgi:hypothetical protein